MIEPGHLELSILKQCELLEVNRSSLFYEPVIESDENLSILSFLDKQYLDTPFYGVERLLVVLVALGYRINRKRLRQLMRLVGWQTLYPIPDTKRIHASAYKYSYLLRDLPIERKNQVWAIDITYLPMRKGFMYLCAVVEVYSRYIVGWVLATP